MPPRPRTLASDPEDQWTVIVAWPVLPSLVARSNALPTFRERTIE